MRPRIVVEKAPKIGEFGEKRTRNFFKRRTNVGEDVGGDEPNWDEQQGESEKRHCKQAIVMSIFWTDRWKIDRLDVVRIPPMPGIQNAQQYGLRNVLPDFGNCEPQMILCQIKAFSKITKRPVGKRRNKEGAGRYGRRWVLTNGTMPKFSILIIPPSRVCMPS